MYYKFIRSSDLNTTSIFKQMKAISGNRSDLPENVFEIDKMISYILPRKQDEFYKQINSKNLPSHLVSFIPTESFEELNLKANSNDPVIYYFII